VIGAGAGSSATGGSLTLIGQDAGAGIGGEGGIIAIGAGAASGSGGLIGAYNTMIGLSAGSNVTGFFNFSLGTDAGQNISGSHNTAIGKETLAGGATGNNNIAIGERAGAIGVNANNIIIGSQSGNINAITDNVILIGVGVETTTGSNEVVLGNESVLNTYLKGNVHINGGTSGQVLSTDGTGNLTWIEQSGGGGPPGGSNTQIQFNDNGAFAGSSQLVFDNSSNTLSVANNYVSLSRIDEVPFEGYENSKGSIKLQSTQTIPGGQVFSGNLSLTFTGAGGSDETFTFPQTQQQPGFLYNTGTGETSWQSTFFDIYLAGQTNFNDAVLITNSYLPIEPGPGYNASGQIKIGSIYDNQEPEPNNVRNTTFVTIQSDPSMGNVDANNLPLYANYTLQLPLTAGNVGEVLSTDGTGITSWVAQSGGGGSPGGSNTQLQFNDNGVFSGISTVTYDGISLNLGDAGNINITGGTNGYVLSTNGSGNLSWVAQSGGGGGAESFAPFLLAGL
jgi:hypothetical protein